MASQSQEPSRPGLDEMGEIERRDLDGRASRFRSRTQGQLNPCAGKGEGEITSKKKNKKIKKSISIPSSLRRFTPPKGGLNGGARKPATKPRRLFPSIQRLALATPAPHGTPNNYNALPKRSMRRRAGTWPYTPAYYSHLQAREIEQGRESRRCIYQFPGPTQAGYMISRARALPSLPGLPGLPGPQQV